MGIAELLVTVASFVLMIYIYRFLGTINETDYYDPMIPWARRGILFTVLIMVIVFVDMFIYRLPTLTPLAPEANLPAKSAITKEPGKLELKADKIGPDIAKERATHQQQIIEFEGQQVEE